MISFCTIHGTRTGYIINRSIHIITSVMLTGVMPWIHPRRPRKKSREVEEKRTTADPPGANAKAMGKNYVCTRPTSTSTSTSTQRIYTWARENLSHKAAVRTAAPTSTPDHPFHAASTPPALDAADLPPLPDEPAAGMLAFTKLGPHMSLIIAAEAA